MTTYYWIDGRRTDETDMKLIDLLMRNGVLVEEEDVHDSDDCDHDECHSDDGSQCDHDYCHDECMSEDYHNEVVEEARQEGYDEGEEAGKKAGKEEAELENCDDCTHQGYEVGKKDGITLEAARCEKTLKELSSETWYLFPPENEERYSSYFRREGHRIGTSLPPGNYYLVPVDVKVKS